MRNNFIVYEKIGCSTCKGKGKTCCLNLQGLEHSSLCEGCEGNGYKLRPYDLELAISIAVSTSKMIRNDIRIHCLDLDGDLEC